MTRLVCLRWWSETVQSLRLCAPPSVLPSVSCRTTTQILKEKALDQAPVTDEFG